MAAMIGSDAPRILIVDGEILIAMEAAQILTEELSCETVAASWSTLDTQDTFSGFRLVIADRDFAPEWFRDALRRQDPARLRRIFLTTSAALFVCPDNDLHQVLVKPFTPSRLVEMVRLALRGEPE
jgi:DNA-binding response OmpR family regulator